MNHEWTRMDTNVKGRGNHEKHEIHEKENKNFLLFDHAFSCHTHTVPVLTYALTAKNQYNNQLLENAVSIIEMAQSAGYKTVWLSNQVRYGA